MKLLISLVLSAVLIGSVSAKETQQILSSEQQQLVDKDDYQEVIFEHVIDGDTLVASGKTIRLWGIDAPEKNEPMYEICAKVLELFAETGKLECKLINFDRYDRQVMHCYSGNSDLGSSMVKTGFAKDYKKYSGGFYQQEQNFAKAGNLGIWE